MRHALADHPLPGIDAARLALLQEADIDSLEAVVDAGPEKLARLTGFDEKTCVALVRVAQSALVRNLPGVLEFVPKSAEAPMERLARGLEGARLVERVLGMVRTARSHLGKRPRKASMAKAHKKARRQLKRLGVVLAALQQDILSDGLSDKGIQHLRKQLSPLDASLRSILDQPVRAETLSRTKTVAKRARKELSKQQLQ
jgi:hypothetical protein